MFSRKQRLPTYLFEEVMRVGTSYHASHFSLRIKQLNVSEPSRFSFSVPKKLDTRATKRNYLRRKFREIVKKHIRTIPYGFGGIFFAKKGAFELSLSEIENELDFLLHKAFKI